MKKELIDKAQGSGSETADLDFKREWDHKEAADFIEIVKDVVAMANSGGGIIVLGVDDDGKVATPSDRTKACDPAYLNDKVFKYTGVQATFVETIKIAKGGVELDAIFVSGTDTPIPFVNPGTYELPDKKQKTVFGRGCVYFRHGAKSEPSTFDDFRRFLEREFQRRKLFLMEGIAKVVEAPTASSIVVVDEKTDSAGPVATTAVRLTTDPTAPMMSAPMVDKTHPYRQKELLKRVNERLPAGRHISTHDFLCIRRAQAIHRDLKYCYNMNWSSPRYSDACVDWLVEQITRDVSFVHRAREIYTDIKGIL
jgi:hypothetical protein